MTSSKYVRGVSAIIQWTRKCSDFCFRSFAQLDGIPSIRQSSILENGKSSNCSIYLRRFGKTMHFPFGSREGFTQTLAVHYKLRTQIVEQLFNDLEHTEPHNLSDIRKKKHLKSDSSLKSSTCFILLSLCLPKETKKFQFQHILFPPAPNAELICWIHRCSQTKLCGVRHIKPST